MSRREPKRYTPRANPVAGTPTKEEHDEWVKANDCTYTHHWMRHLDAPRRAPKLKEGE